MAHWDESKREAGKERQPGFSLIELIVVVAVLTSVSGIILTVMFQMAMTQNSVGNRTEMHSGVRSATELLQQEIGQAGRAASTADPTSPATLTQDVAGDGASHSPTVTSVNGLFPGVIVLVGPDTTNGPDRELFTIKTVGSNTITGVWQNAHSGTALNKARIAVQGVFASGIVPPTGSKVISWSTATSLPVVTTLTAGTTPGSSAIKLKMYGDINADGNMVYIEYACNQGTTSAPGTLTRTVIPYDTALAKNATNFPPQTLLSNILANPGGTDCFAYQTKVVGNDTYVVDVAVTLTVQTENRDSKTGQYQTETKALLNVSPRNVYEGWQMASLAGGNASRIQPMPESILNLLNP